MSVPAQTNETPGSTGAPGAPWWHYREPEHGPDEVATCPGLVRDHWWPFVRTLNALGHDEVLRRWDDAQGLIRQNGVTYNVYGDPRGLERPWQLDPIPLLLSPSEWASLEQGLLQRAQVLDLVLADLYGPQQLVTRGLLPPQLVFGNAGYLRACHGLRIPFDRHLHFYAADLGRTSDGAYRVLGDRAQAPSGAGYALQNRLVLARMWPDVFRDCGVQRLARFFQSVRDGLHSLAPHNRDTPRIVLLTPGPYNETYYEQAFLARYLGYTLVEGADLTVRDNRVYLKQLGGLQPVDVILRRLDGDFCDPLELREDSFLGVPGLIQAVYSGNVAVANSLGSGLVESPAFHPYLPAVCRALLGEDLRLDSVRTWWCGDPTAQEHVLTHLDEMVIKPAFSNGHFDAIFAGDLGPAQRSRVADRIRARPGEHVAQERISLSTAPVLVEGRLEPRKHALRAYLTARPDGYVVMPGGLTRTSRSAESPIVSMQQGGASKDTWVLASGTVSPFSLLPAAHQSIELSRGGSDLPSRVADNLFWLGRYVERAEALIRLIRVVLERMDEQSGFGDVPELPILLRALAHAVHSDSEPPMAEILDPYAWFEDALAPILFASDRAGSLAATFSAVHRIATMVRDRISLDLWRTLRRLDLFEAHGERGRSGAWREGEEGPSWVGPQPSHSEVLEQLDEAVTMLAAFSGLVAENMTRGPGWTFLDMGRRLERAQNLARLLKDTLITKTAAESRLLEAVLAIADSSMTYRRRYLAGLHTPPVVDLLLGDESNPRSIAFQMSALLASLDSLPGEKPGAARSQEQRIALSLLTELRLLEIDRLTQVDPTGRRPEFERLLERIVAEVPALSNALAGRYFNHLQTSRHLARSSGHPPQ
jgi:uncharacterized circularly permuted ATP-grasp superfamily protein/uncharacterized alpha-E superfamily protein